jgi:hypothetical protein
MFASNAVTRYAETSYQDEGFDSIKLTSVEIDADETGEEGEPEEWVVSVETEPTFCAWRVKEND